MQNMNEDFLKTQVVNENKKELNPNNDLETQEFDIGDFNIEI